VVVADSRSPRDGKFIEIIGHYNPRTDPPTIEIKLDRALYWLSHGAQPSEVVADLMRRKGIWEWFQRLKAGEPLEALLAEAKAVQEAAQAAEIAPPEPEEAVPSEEMPPAEPEEIVEAEATETVEEVEGEEEE